MATREHVAVVQPVSSKSQMHWRQILHDLVRPCRCHFCACCGTSLVLAYGALTKLSSAHPHLYRGRRACQSCTALRAVQGLCSYRSLKHEHSDACCLRALNVVQDLRPSNQVSKLKSHGHYIVHGRKPCASLHYVNLLSLHTNHLGA